MVRSGWNATTSDFDHGRFEPGTLLDHRYRIVGRLGRGGMGDVYRADDLKLGQPVALKFLPESVDRDPARLTQLHTEVRMARQVSHPNVCRVYDAGEYEGHTFLSMEYVDGEDLASLLRRIGRLQEDRALELARQICAGLAAAHDRGVVHRDLKPANIMLDGSGRIRITDFGLAGAAGETLRAGTPAYMAPEQLAGGDITPRSDIYSLGLVLYELFTGKRALEADTMAELIAKREQGLITPPAEIVRGLDPATERVIMRCLDVDPARRPGSALSVAAALPGGDPLAAALAAGETPSPDMVAASGSTDRLSSRLTIAGGALVIAGLAAIALLYQHVVMVNIVPMPKPPDALIDRAQEMVTRFGYANEARATASGMSTSIAWASYIAATADDRHRWSALSTPRPVTIYLWHRTSPQVLIPVGVEDRIDGTEPPMTVPGMTLTLVDTAGRLVQFIAVPVSEESGGTAADTVWSKLFDAAALPMAGFTPATPEVLPRSYADERRAWEGPLPERPDLRVRVEAAAYHGRPVFFAVTGAWNRPARVAAPGPGSQFSAVTQQLTTLIMPGLMVVGVVLARRNVLLGRGDRRGAFRAAAALFCLLLTAWVLGDRHVAHLGGEIEKFFNAIGRALFGGAVLWLTYLGLEPYVRRSSPESLIGWTRLIAGNWRDPRVGRDVLIGVLAGLAATLVVAAHNLLPLAAGRPESVPLLADPGLFISFRYPFAAVFDRARDALSSAMLGMAGYTALYILFKRRWLAFVAAVICYTPVAVNGLFAVPSPLLDTAAGFAVIIIFVGVIARAGLLATVATLMTHFFLLHAPITTDLSNWRAPYGLVFAGTVLVAGLGGAALAAGRFRIQPALARSR
jgi:serine/threonine-protein kinase